MLTRPRGPAHAPSLRFWRVHRRTSALFVVPALSLTTALVTGVLYLLPLSQATTDLVSNISFVIIALVLIGSVGRAVRLVTGIDRLAWGCLSISLLGAVSIFVLDPAGSNAPPTAALLAGPFVAASVVVVVFAFGRHGLRTLDITRLVLDGLWIAAGLTVAGWHWVFAPLPDVAGSTAGLVLIASFPVISAMAAVGTLLVIPRVAGPSRLPYISLGLGSATTVAAGAIHIRMAYEGTLVFGTWYDFLWMIGLPLLALAALDPSLGVKLHRVRPSARSHQVITVVPLLTLMVPFLIDDAWPSTPPIFAIVLLVILAARVVVLVSQNELLAAKLRAQAHLDELTGLLNRRALMLLLTEDSVANTRPRSSALQPHPAHGGGTANPDDVGPGRSVLCLDLDGFKTVNDRHGHAAGDRVLLMVANRLRASTRPTDHIARLGGDEFVVLTDAAEPLALAHRLLEAVSEPIEWEGAHLEVGCSIGVASRSRVPGLELLAAADAALYCSKRAGKSTVTLATTDIDDCFGIESRTDSLPGKQTEVRRQTETRR